MKEGVVRDKEEEGGQRAPLLDAPPDVNPVGGLAPKKGGNPHGGEGTFDKILKPGGESYPT